MALPPMKAARTAAGITIDPQTLERVVPTSRRKDGSVRKELKIRPGFTPQEDVGRFRGSRQQASDQGSMIPGSTRTRPPPSSQVENPFASNPSTSTSSSQQKTKAQVKNEKRREKKKTSATTKAWDESGDDSDEEDIGEAFKAEEARRMNPDQLSEEVEKGEKVDKQGTEQAKTKNEKTSEPAWPVDDGGQGMISEAAPDGGGPPDDPIPIEPAVEDKKDNDEMETTILSPVPPGPETKDPAAPTVRPTPNPNPTPTPTSSTPEWRTASSSRKSKPQQKPHPIQGGRQGPIGLAHPPPIEPSKPSKPSRSRQNSSRSKKTNDPKLSTGDSFRPPQTQAQTKEPRVRKEVKVRETGMGSLADRVKNLVIGTQGAEQKKKEKSAPEPKSEPAAGA